VDHEVAVDEVNRATWSRAAQEFLQEGWSDRGELEALLAVADTARGGPVLDLGVGAGRTVALLRLLSSDYLGLDYTPEMVALCRSRHPGVDIRVGDARALREVATGSRALVVFSLNGIDAVGHADRQRVLAEVARVLRPDGRLVLSTLNKDGPLCGCHPGTVPDLPWAPGSLLPVRVPVPLPPDDERAMRAVRNWRRLRRVSVEGDGWAIGPLPAHEFRVLAHFTTVPRALEELRAHGLEPLDVFPAETGVPLAPGERTRAAYVHITARRG